MKKGFSPSGSPFPKNFYRFDCDGLPMIWTMTGVLVLALGGVAYAAEEKALPPVEEMQDILDLKAPVGLPFDWTPYLWALAGCALLAAAFWAWRRWSKRRRARSVAPKPPSPHEMLERELAQLAGLRPGQAREFYFRLSAALREYIERTSRVRAMEMTTEELLPRLDSLPVDHHLRLSLKDCFRRADPVKFAGESAEAGLMRADLDLAVSFLAAARPPEPAEAPEKGAVGAANAKAAGHV